MSGALRGLGVWEKLLNSAEAPDTGVVKRRGVPTESGALAMLGNFLKTARSVLGAWYQRDLEPVP